MTCSLSLNIRTALLVLFLTGTALAGSPLTTITRWSIDPVGNSAAPGRQDQMVILDPDHHAPLSSYPPGCLKLASFNIGEAEDRRAYWARISSASYLIEQDKDQEGLARVDFRDPGWQSILDEEVSRRLAEGFQGFVLEGIDSVPILEEKSAERFEGIRDALTHWLNQLRRQHPDLILLAKGSEALEIAAPYVDGYMVEGIYSSWDPVSRRVRRTTREERDELLDQIGNALTAAPHPVFTVEYAAWAAREARRQFRPNVKDFSAPKIR
jgi:uncharacterized protein (TIGR01370 family)